MPRFPFNVWWCRAASAASAKLWACVRQGYIVATARLYELDKHEEIGGKVDELPMHARAKFGHVKEGKKATRG